MPSSATTLTHLRALSPCAVDPFDEELTPLSFAGIDWLIEHAFIEPGPTSPLTPQYAYRSRSSRSDREEAGAELARRGLVSRAWVPDERRVRLVGQSALGRSLSILERPQQLLRLGLGRPDDETHEVRVYVADGRAVVCGFGPSGASIGQPFSLVALLAFLTDELDSTEPGTAEPADGEDHQPGKPSDALCVWPTLFRLATALWPESGNAPDAELRAGELAALLTDDPGGARVRSLFAEMVAAEVAEPASTGVVLSPRYRRWLEPVWSGHVFEIEHARLSEGNSAVTGRLLFAGPRGERVLCQDAVSRALLADAGKLQVTGLHAGDALPDEGLMVFSRPSRDELKDLVTDLLGQRQRPALRAVAL